MLRCGQLVGCCWRRWQVAVGELVQPPGSIIVVSNSTGPPPSRSIRAISRIELEPELELELELERDQLEPPGARPGPSQTLRSIRV